MFLATCLFGITFIVLENTAPNSIAFAQNILDAANAQATPGKVIAIAIAANTFCCLLHSLSRKWGILLNNFLGVVKLCILVFVVIIGLVWINTGVSNPNYALSTSFTAESSPRWPYRYAEAFIYVMFPYGGFHQINYVRLTALLDLIHSDNLCRSSRS
jgi:amino acid transporter